MYPALPYPCRYPYHLFLFLPQSLALALRVTGELGMQARAKVMGRGFRLGVRGGQYPTPCQPILTLSLP